MSAGHVLLAQSYPMGHYIQQPAGLNLLPALLLIVAVKLTVSTLQS